MRKHHCQFLRANGQVCLAAPLRDGDFCLMHDPDHVREVQEARRLGGHRRKREVAVSGAYEVNGLRILDDVRRVLEIAVLDTLAMENSISRSRTLAYLSMAALKTLERGEYEARIAGLEAALSIAPARDRPLFDQAVEGEFEERSSAFGQEPE